MARAGLLAALGMEHHLQPLQVPTGWIVVFNDFREIDPTHVAEDDRYAILKEDLLQLTNDQFNRVLNVGWYPSGNLADGAYGLVVYEGDCEGKLLFELRTHDRGQLVAQVERLLEEVCDGR